MRLRAQKMLASPLHRAMTPLVRESKHLVIDQLTLDRRGLTILYVQPAGQQRRFLLKEHGFPLLTQEKLDALLYLLQKCNPYLRDEERYRLHKKRVRLVNGQKETVYTFVITNEYKKILCRAPYYRDDAQTDALIKTGWI